jgi:hypothetical protein
LENISALRAQDFFAFFLRGDVKGGREKGEKGEI